MPNAHSSEQPSFLVDQTAVCAIQRAKHQRPNLTARSERDEERACPWKISGILCVGILWPTPSLAEQQHSLALVGLLTPELETSAFSPHGIHLQDECRRQWPMNDVSWRTSRQMPDSIPNRSV